MAIVISLLFPYSMMFGFESGPEMTVDNEYLPPYFVIHLGIISIGWYKQLDED